ncbi:hypothetical protein CRG98_023900 [Punica granatum]|uniref:Uncharacterized protein n=1 Tax=Punica granatum TaxID=22663 RepID=A0A2I0JHE7_PUNGR|nr:hypothetical protein CRG98_023900 [Punica granatum]
MRGARASIEKVKIIGDEGEALENHLLLLRLLRQSSELKQGSPSTSSNGVFAFQSMAGDYDTDGSSSTKMNEIRLN